MPPKAPQLETSRFAEPSEPSDNRPEDNPKEQLMGNQEENPQVVAHNRGEQAADYGRGSGRGSLKEAKRDEGKGRGKAKGRL
ncbi:uncharacterized protein LAESUDRAFT_724760 [Laetiporus sulphureus 93-53]|uniref:Uncharacterized protein n=1 Tax=Laetiporus sulphureus 93-53 TaxID=1314785 RepID=A0A165EU33_9APHY|nr:uncharacterized protein LAESUDRAFT_724760 [Laetiporus sulphureus 93-53]KZT07764.1 hypothetical protein LAESUDRAFT_724760 [Laetiporus sulphureus 93-53]